MASAEMEFVLQKLVDTRDARFLLFLSNLCVCDGRPIPSTQSMCLPLQRREGGNTSDALMFTDTVLNKLLRAHGKSVFFRLEVRGSDSSPEEGVVFYQRPGSAQWLPLLDIASRVSASLSLTCCVSSGSCSSP